MSSLKIFLDTSSNRSLFVWVNSEFFIFISVFFFVENVNVNNFGTDNVPFTVNFLKVVPLFNLIVFKLWSSNLFGSQFNFNNSGVAVNRNQFIRIKCDREVVCRKRNGKGCFGLFFNLRTGRFTGFPICIDIFVLRCFKILFDTRSNCGFVTGFLFSKSARACEKQCNQSQT